MTSSYQLRWSGHDPENFFGFTCKKFTGVNYIFTFLLGLLFTGIFYGILFKFAYQGNDYIDMFFHGGIRNRSSIPYYTMFLTFWACAILLVKHLKLRLQRKALTIHLISSESDFVLTPVTAREILRDLYEKVDQPQRFALFDRVERALSNLKNLGNVQDVAEGLSAKAENDETYLGSTYTIFKGFLWAIPVLGFIGTVLGLSQSIGGFGNVLAKNASLEVLKDSLGGVTAGLGIAFETTLIALVAALIVQILMSFLENEEEIFLDECSDYCHKYIISKLKVANLRDDL